MELLSVRAYAKVNLTLDVLEKRQEDGYHYVRMVMLPISLCDEIVLRLAEDISVTCLPEIAGPPASNLAYRAALLLKTVTGYKGGASIRVEKRIPVAGGLAGGSTDAAAVLKGLNQLWGTGLSEVDLISLAIKLGSDVPFFVPQTPARVEGIGELLTPLAVFKPLWMVLVTPEIPKSTGNVYRLFDDLSYEGPRPNHRMMEAALAEGDLPGIAHSLGNVFEHVMLPLHPEMVEIKQAMRQAGAMGTLMSGAGPTVFGLVDCEETGRQLLSMFRRKGKHAYLTHSVGCGGHQHGTASGGAPGS